jgi:hypothetical protein
MPPGTGVDRRLSRRLAHRVLRGVDRLRGRAPAARGDFVVFTDAALAADAGCRSAVVHRVAAPRETREDLAWAVQVEPIARPERYRPFSEPAPATTRRVWVEGDSISRDPDEAVAGREIAAATQADYVGLIPAPMLDQYVEHALEDIGFHADVQFDQATQAFEATLAAPASDPAGFDAGRPPVDLLARRAASSSPSAGDPAHEERDGATEAGVHPATPDPDTATPSASSGRMPTDPDDQSTTGGDSDPAIDLATVEPDVADLIETRLPDTDPTAE